MAAHHDCKCNHNHRVHSDIGKNNQEHYDKVAATIFDTPWIRDLTNQISNELREQVNWIDFRRSTSGDTGERATKMLDYACGNGVVSRALAPYVSITRGIDISAGMAQQYNLQAETNGYSTEKMRAVHGDLVNTMTNPSVDLTSPEFTNFELVVMSMALHHVDDPGLMIKTLSEKLGPGGVLLIIDWVSESESGCAPIRPPADSLVKHAVSRMGFEEKELGGWFSDAGLDDFGWRWFSSRSQIPEEHGGPKQLFLARAVKKDGEV